MIQSVDIKSLKVNTNNPRVIKDDKFKLLVKSIKEFPEMLELRPIVINSDNVILGGNMRYRACVDAGITHVPVIYADTLDEQKQKEFIIKDNSSYGEWNWDLLANEWDVDNLKDWGLSVPTMINQGDIDYSILNDTDIDETIESMSSSVRKAIQIEFEPEHYDEATKLVKFWRDQKLYIGGFLIEKLKQEKEKL